MKTGASILPRMARVSHFAAIRATARFGVPVTMGIRPEDLAIETTIHAGHDALRGKVVLVERLGGTSHIHFEVGQHRLLASVANQALPDVGDDIAAHVPESRAHLFSADGVALTRA
jgi:ABC-type sugar transport system ATPase subunit